MDFNHNEYDSFYNQMCDYIEWFGKQSLTIHHQEVVNSVKEENPQDYFQVLNQNDQGNDENSDDFINMGQMSQEINEKEEICKNLSLKKKCITKANKKYKQQNSERGKNSFTKNKVSSSKKSKYNNMGGFLIGTVSQILNNRAKYRFVDGVYQIFMNCCWVQIGKIDNNDSFDALLIEKELALLKFKLSSLPRKEGAKKHLYEILNDDFYDKEETKMSKNLMRKEVLYSLGQKGWLKEHVASRDFKPENDDQRGSKKKERHQAYLKYLKAIEVVLGQKNMIPKRMTV